MGYNMTDNMVDSVFVSVLGFNFPLLAETSFSRLPVTVIVLNLNITINTTGNSCSISFFLRLFLHDFFKCEVLAIYFFGDSTHPHPPSKIKWSVPNQLQFYSFPTQNDLLLVRILHYTLSHFPTEPTKTEKPYFHKRLEIRAAEEYLLWGMHVIMPKSFRACILEEIHTRVPGIVRIKSLARFHVWWPGLDKEVAEPVHDCTPC